MPKTTSVTRPAVVDTNRLVERGHLTTSSEFTSAVSQWRTEAQRRKADLETEVERFEAEIQSRLALIADEQEILARCEAALTIDLRANRPAPTLEERLSEPMNGAGDA